MSQDFLPGLISLTPADKESTDAVNLLRFAKITQKIRDITLPGFHPAIRKTRDFGLTTSGQMGAPIITSVDVLQGQGIFTAEFFRSLQKDEVIERMDNVVDVKIHSVCPVGDVNYILAVIYLCEYTDEEITSPLYYLFGVDPKEELPLGWISLENPSKKLEDGQNIHILAYRGRLIIMKKNEADSFVPSGWQSLGLKKIPILPLTGKWLDGRSWAYYICDNTTSPETLLVASSCNSGKKFSLARCGQWVETEEGGSLEILMETTVKFQAKIDLWLFRCSFSIDCYGRIFVLQFGDIILFSPDLRKLAEYVVPEINMWEEGFNLHSLLRNISIYPYQYSVFIAYEPRGETRERQITLGVKKCLQIKYHEVD